MFHPDAPGLSGIDLPYLRVIVDEVSSIAVPLAEGTGGGVGCYFLDPQDLVDAGLAAGEYGCKIFRSATPSETADDPFAATYHLSWDGTNENGIGTVRNDVSDLSLQTGEAIVKTSGGAFRTSLSGSFFRAKEIQEIYQGEAKTLTFMVEADTGLFENQIPELIEAKIQDPKGVLITKTWIGGSDSDDQEEIKIIAHELDLQVFRVVLKEEDTALLSEGLLRIELTIDKQKARLTHILKVIPTLVALES